MVVRALVWHSMGATLDPPPPSTTYLWFAFVCFLIRSHPPSTTFLSFLQNWTMPPSIHVPDYRSEM